MSRIRVLELIKGLDVGGAEKLLVERLAVTNVEQFDVALGYLDASRSALRPALDRIGLRVFCLDGSRRLSGGWLLRLRRELLRRPVDVVHVHSPLMAVGVRLVLRSLGARAPAMASTEHSVAYHPATMWLARKTVGHDDAVLAVSTAVAESPVAKAAGDRVVLVHHGVDLSGADALRSRRRSLTRELGLPTGQLVVSVANYRPEKDLSTLLRAARRVHRSIPEAHFILVGSGPTRDDLERQIAEQGLDTYVHLLGHVDDAVRVTACADLFAMTSVREGLPVAAMEALACGVPIVATDVGGLRDLVIEGQTGALVSAGDDAAVADRISGILADSAWQSKLSRGARIHSARFDIRATARQIEGIYRRLATGG